MRVREGAIGQYPCLIAGDGPPLIVLAGLSPDAGVAPGPMRRTHEQALQPWARGRRVFYVNRRPGLPAGLSMRALAAEHAVALEAAFDEPVDVLGLSTGGSIAQQLAAELVPPWRGRYLAAVLAWTVGPRLFGAEDLRDMATTIEAEDAFDLAACPVLRSPTLLIAGGRDRFYEPELFHETVRLIPGCRLSLHPERGHVSVVSSPRTIAEALGFLNRDVPGRS
jgi:pimeloyl-ACP methyl ester carboxylesterase